MVNRNWVADIDYHRTAWLQFTTLSDEEEKKLKSILRWIKHGNKISVSAGKIRAKQTAGKRKAVVCKETGQVWKNKTECAKSLGVSRSAISLAIKYNRRVGWLYHISEIKP